MTARRSLHERMLEADVEARRLTANARAADEAGHRKKAVRLWDAAQKALDRWNRLAESEATR